LRLSWHGSLIRWQSGIAGLAAVLATAPALADSYTIDPSHSIPAFEFSHLGLTTQSGRFERAKGTVVLDFGRRRGSVSYEIETASLKMGSGANRENSPEYQLFKIEKYPRITFTSSKLIFDKDGHVAGADGKVTLVGVTRPLKVTVERFKCSANPLNGKPMCSGDISATIKRSEFGMTKFIPAISDEVRISVPVEAYRD
jgi:polyisoprenoid-binding protein YceI